MEVIIGIFIFLIILAMPGIILVKIDESKQQKKNQRELIYNKKNQIPKNRKLMICNELNEEQYSWKDSLNYDKGKAFNIWKEDNCIKLAEAFKENENIIVNKIIIPIENIKYFTRDGEYRIDNIVEGGGVSLGGAIVGGIVGGGAGAVLGGRKEIKTTQNEKDDRKTYLYYKENNEEKRIVFFSKEYSILLELIPNKDFKFIEEKKIVEASEPKENSIYKDIGQLAKLKDKGILTEEEFDEKKRVLLERIQ